MTNKANSMLSFLRRNLKGCPEKLKQTAYFSFICSFMEYGATVWHSYQKYNSDNVERVPRRPARFVKSIQDTLVFLICLRVAVSFSKETRGSTNFVLQHY